MNKKPTKAFILAAGKGTRLRPYTDTIPKPMVEIAGKSIIKRTIEKLHADGVHDIVVNLHHLGDTLKAHLSDIKPPIIFSEEHDLLETGGGIKKALHHFGNEPFYIINGDALWDDGNNGSVFSRLAALWDETKMDILLFIQPKDKMNLTGFVGDYHMHGDCKLTRAMDKSGKHMFAGIRLAHPRIFKNSPDGYFSFLTLMDKAESQDRLYGMPHDDAWYHISTPEDLQSVDTLFRKRGA